MFLTLLCEETSLNSSALKKTYKAMSKNQVLFNTREQQLGWATNQIHKNKNQSIVLTGFTAITINS